MQGLGLADRAARRARPGRRQPPVHLHRASARPAAPCTPACRRISTSRRRAPTGPDACAPDPRRPGLPPRSVGSPEPRWSTACATSPAACPPRGHDSAPPCAGTSPGCSSRAGAGRVPSAPAAASPRPFRAIRGASTFRPSDSTAKCVSPRSIPTSRDDDGSGESGTSTTNEAWYRPAASTVTVTLDGSPGSSRDQRTGTSPIPGSRSRPLGSTRNRAALVNRIDCAAVLASTGTAVRASLRPFRFPVTEAKKFRYAVFASASACCKHHRRHLGQPRPLRGPLRRRQRLRQLRVGRVRLPSLAGLPGGRRPRR